MTVAPIRAVRVMLLLVVLAYAGHGVLVREPSFWVEGVLVAAAAAMSGASILAAARFSTVDRVSALCLGLALECWAIGNAIAAYQAYVLGGYSSPGWADPFFVVFAPLAAVAVVRTLCGTLGTHRGARLDATIIGLAVITVALAIVGPTLRDGLGDEGLTVTLSAWYPVTDLVLLAVVVAALATQESKVSAGRRALAFGLAAFTIGDVAYFAGVAHGTRAPGVLVFAGWLVGLALMAEAPWLPTFGRARPTVSPSLLAPVTASVVVTALLILDSPFPRVLGPLAEAAAAITLAVVLVRLVHTLREDRRLASTDPLTRLANRTHFMALVELDLDLVRTTGGSLVLLLVDLKGFKEINDTFGHLAGDLLLEQVARRLEAALPEGDRLARLGSDEFGVAATRTRFGPADAVAMARALQRGLAVPLAVGTSAIPLRASIGVAFAPLDAQTRSELLRNADVAMYRAKSLEDGLAVYDPDLDVVDTDRLALAGDLAVAIEARALTLHFQPVVDAGTLDYVGAEALARWEHPRLGLLAPASFVPLAHRIGATREFTRQVIEKALVCTRLLRSDGSTGHVAVNIAADDLLTPGFVAEVGRMLDRHQLAGDALRIEITEEVFVEQPELARASIEALRQRGIGVDIDDFGTGFSSLSYLQNLPVQILKIDQSFVARLDDAERQHADRAIAVVSAVVALAHMLGMRCVAEGVQTRSQLAVLRDLGCDLVQGYLVARPMPIEELRGWRLEAPARLRRAHLA